MQATRRTREWADNRSRFCRRRGGLDGRATVDLRMIVNAILYILATGCQWRALPADFPPRSTVQGYFYRWRDDGTVALAQRPSW